MNPLLAHHELGARRQADQALVPTASSPQAVSTEGFDPSRGAVVNLFGETQALHQSQLPPAENKFHAGNGDDGKHYWLTPPALYASLNVRFNFDFDPCPYPLPDGFDGLTCEWGRSSYANIPFGSIMHQGPNDRKAKKKGPTAWVRKALAEQAKGKRVVMVYPVDKWLLMLLAAGAKVENLGDVRWCATEDGSQGKGTGRHIACFILEPAAQGTEAGTAETVRHGSVHDGPVVASGGDAPTPSRSEQAK